MFIWQSLITMSKFSSGYMQNDVTGILCLCLFLVTSECPYNSRHTISNHCGKINLVDVLLQLAGNVIKYSCRSNLNLYRKWAFSISLYPFFPPSSIQFAQWSTEIPKQEVDGLPSSVSFSVTVWIETSLPSSAA